MYEFGPFRLDPAKRLLLRGEDPVALTPKAFETLLLLVENRDRALLKDELMSRLWPESFVEEANLSQTIFVLRKILGDTVQDQRYIVTVRGTGYRFAEPVRENKEKEKEDGKPILSQTPTADGAIGFQSNSAASVRNWRVLLGYALIGAVVAAGVLYWRSHSSSPLTEKDTILLTDFDNSTGDPIFDGTLRQALAIQLEQSPFLKVLSDQRANATLKLMNRTPTNI